MVGSKSKIENHHNRYAKNILIPVDWHLSEFRMYGCNVGEQTPSRCSL